MKAKIVSKIYYVAETEDGKKFDVDIRNSIIKHAFDNNLEIEGEIYREEKQDKYVNGEYARSYTVRERFVPKREKISLSKEPIIDPDKVIHIDPVMIREDHEYPTKPKRPRLHLTIPTKEDKKE